MPTQRYRFDCDGIATDDEGDWVKYDSHVANMEALAEYVTAYFRPYSNKIETFACPSCGFKWRYMSDSLFCPFCGREQP